MDSFDLDDAYGPKKEHICSKDLKKFMKDNHLDLNTDGSFNPRYVFGSHSDADHVYNTPRAWFGVDVYAVLIHHYPRTQ